MACCTFEPQKKHFVGNAKRARLIFPRQLSRRALRSPPRDPLTYTQIYYVLAHLGLRNNVFYGPDQNRPFRQPPGDPRRRPASPGAPPGTPPGPGRNPTEKTRHFRRMRPHFPDSVANSDERGRNCHAKTHHFDVPGRLLSASRPGKKRSPFRK